MSTSADGSRDERALVALAELTRDGVEQPTEAELEQGLDALFARIASQRSRRRKLVRWSLVGATAAVCAIVGLQMLRASRTRAPAARQALAYQIEGGSVLEGGYLRESGHEGIKLSFSEGSKLVLLSGARGRLRSVDKAGARVAIEQGTASFQVAPKVDQRWLVEAGPFLVTVRGTVFSVSWDPSSERFELNLRHGRVVVSGPVTGGDIVLRAGQRLVVNLSRAETLITEEPMGELAGTGSLAPLAPPAPPSVVRPSSTKDRLGAATQASAGKGESGRRWSDELVSGHWDRILQEVERIGLQATLDQVSSEDLYALAHAARYRRRTDVARAALLAQRRRFSGSPRALDALFLLGRVEESYERGMTRAIAWYDEYLHSAPKGAYAAEALGRKMTLTNELGGNVAARPIAEEYLRRFPKGSYAGSARALSRVP